MIEDFGTDAARDLWHMIDQLVCGEWNDWWSEDAKQDWLNAVKAVECDASLGAFDAAASHVRLMDGLDVEVVSESVGLGANPERAIVDLNRRVNVTLKAGAGSLIERAKVLDWLRGRM